MDSSFSLLQQIQITHKTSRGLYPPLTFVPGQIRQLLSLSSLPICLLFGLKILSDLLLWGITFVFLSEGCVACYLIVPDAKLRVFQRDLVAVRFTNNCHRCRSHLSVSPASPATQEEELGGCSSLIFPKQIHIRTCMKRSLD